jgi:hypothetical protein
MLPFCAESVKLPISNPDLWVRLPGVRLPGIRLPAMASRPSRVGEGGRNTRAIARETTQMARHTEKKSKALMSHTNQAFTLESMNAELSH